MSRPKVGSLFTGIAGFDRGFELAGFDVAWQCEIDRDCTNVLERHYPTTTRHRDVTQVDPAELPPVDVVVFGSPCQGFSVAGNRGGLADERSGLFGEAIRIIRGLRPKPAFCVWENVPGALTTGSDPDDPDTAVRGRDFAAVLAALADSRALDVAWGVLDSQGVGDCALHRDDTGFWAVPQRRRRIFLVADFGGERAVEILALPDRLSRHPQTRRATRQGAPAVAADGAGSGGVAGTLRSHTRPGSNDVGQVVPDVANSLLGYAGRNQLEATYIPDLSNTLRANNDSFGGQKGASALLAAQIPPVSGTLTGGAHPGSYNGQDAFNDLLIPQTVRPLMAGTSPHGHGTAGVNDQAVNSGHVIAQAPSVAAPLTAGSAPNSTAPGRHREDDENLIVAAFDESQITSRENRAQPEPGSPATTLNGSGRASVVGFNWQQCADNVDDGTPTLTTTRVIGDADHAAPWIVRRLTPRECERLQGFPDDWTKWRADGSEIPDGPRYRMLGNAVSVTVAYWLGRRVYAALEAAR